MVHGHNTAPTWILFKNSEDSSVLKTSFGSKVHVTILHPKNWMAASTERSSAWKPWGHSQKEFCSFSTLLPEVPRHKCFWKVSYRIIFNYTGHTFIIYHQFMANVSWIFHIWRIWEYWSWGESPENTSTGIFHRTNSCPTKNIQQILPTNMVSFSVILGILSTCKQTFVQLDIWYMYIYICIYSCCLQLLLHILLAVMFHPNHGAMPPSTHPTPLEPCGTSLGQWMHWWHNKLFHSVNETWPWKIHSMVYIYIHTLYIVFFQWGQEEAQFL